MAKPTVAIVATLATKSVEANYLKDRIIELGGECLVIDASIESGERWLAGEDKLSAMTRASQSAGSELARKSRGSELRVVVGMGGGTGSQIAASALSLAGADAWKVLITTQAFDTRKVAGLDDAIIIPAVADIEGLNRITRQVLRAAAKTVIGLAELEPVSGIAGCRELVAVTALGITSRGVNMAKCRLETAGYECAVFHANGYGGNTLARLACRDVFCGILDYTIHELVSLCLDPDTSVAQDRFDAPAGCPRVLLAGGVNFMTRPRGAAFGLDPGGRPQYSHSPELAHIGLLVDELAGLGRALAGRLSSSGAAAAVIIPMGGFSSEDRPGGTLENRKGREAFADAVLAESSGNVEILRTDGHVNDPATAELAAGKLTEMMDMYRKGHCP